MCGRFDTSHLSWAEIHAQLSKFAPVLTPPQNMEPNGDVRPTQTVMVAVSGVFGWVVEPMRWGLVPYFRNGKPLKDSAPGKNDGWKVPTFNCRVETAWEKPTWKQAIRRRRCVVPANAWFEWSAPPGGAPDEPKVKRRFARADGAPLLFAGLWDRCTTSDAGEILSCSILCGPSAGWMGAHHDRAPIVVEPDELGVWMRREARTEPLFNDSRPERFVLSPSDPAPA